MPSPKKDTPNKPKAVRRRDDAPVADTAAKPARRRNGASAKPVDDARVPPPNARVVKFHPKPGTVSRAAVRAAVKRLKDRA